MQSDLSCQRHIGIGGFRKMNCRDNSLKRLGENYENKAPEDTINFSWPLQGATVRASRLASLVVYVGLWYCSMHRTVVIYHEGKDLSSML